MNSSKLIEVKKLCKKYAGRCGICPLFEKHKSPYRCKITGYAPRDWKIRNITPLLIDKERKNER